MSRQLFKVDGGIVESCNGRLEYYGDDGSRRPVHLSAVAVGSDGRALVWWQQQWFDDGTGLVYECFRGTSSPQSLGAISLPSPPLSVEWPKTYGDSWYLYHATIAAPSTR